MRSCAWCRGNYWPRNRQSKYCSKMCRLKSSGHLGKTQEQLSCLVLELGRMQKELLQIKHSIKGQANRLACYNSRNRKKR